MISLSEPISNMGVNLTFGKIFCTISSQIFPKFPKFFCHEILPSKCKLHINRTKNSGPILTFQDKLIHSRPEVPKMRHGVDYRSMGFQGLQ